jgi:hypothetical protein
MGAEGLKVAQKPDRSYPTRPGREDICPGKVPEKVGKKAGEISAAKRPTPSES